MHAIVQICSLLLLSVTGLAMQPIAKRMPTTTKHKDHKEPLSAPPNSWAVRDWVPEKNRRADHRNMPVGKGELEPEPNYRRSPTKHSRMRRHHLSKRKGTKDIPHFRSISNIQMDTLKHHMIKPKTHVDILNKRILRDFERIIHKLHVPKKEKWQALRKSNKRVAKKSRNVKILEKVHRKSMVKKLPKDFRRFEQSNLKFPNSDICSERQLKSQYLLLPWWYYYCSKHQDKAAKTSYHGDIYMPVYRQILDTVKKINKRKKVTSRTKRILKVNGYR